MRETTRSLATQSFDQIVARRTSVHSKSAHRRLELAHVHELTHSPGRPGSIRASMNGSNSVSHVLGSGVWGPRRDSRVSDADHLNIILWAMLTRSATGRDLIGY